MLHIITPYRTDKNLGKAYNDAIALLPGDCFVCLTDIDLLFLTPEQPAIIEGYCNRFPNALLTCFTNRVSNLAGVQMLGGSASDNPNILDHINIAQQIKGDDTVTPILRGEISGYLMAFHKSLWDEIKFDEGIGCLAVDTYFSRKVVKSGRKILRMNGVYVWHTYRMWKDIKDKSHLK